MARSSSARKKARRERARRAKRAHDKLVGAFDFDAVFNFDTLFAAAKTSKRGVTWKNSVIAFDKNRFGIIWLIFKVVLTRTAYGCNAHSLRLSAVECKNKNYVLG